MTRINNKIPMADSRTIRTTPPSRGRMPSTMLSRANLLIYLKICGAKGTWTVWTVVFGTICFRIQYCHTSTGNMWIMWKQTQRGFPVSASLAGLISATRAAKPTGGTREASGYAVFATLDPTRGTTSRRGQNAIGHHRRNMVQPSISSEEKLTAESEPSPRSV